MNRYQKSLNALSNNYEGVVPNHYSGGLGQKRSYEGVVPNRFSGSPDSVDFADENQLAEDQQFAFTVQNLGTSAVDRNIALCPAYFTPEQVALMKDNLGNTIDAIITSPAQ
jgi:hypothetical protein